MSAPREAPIIMSGARMPPLVPDPSAADQITSLVTRSSASVPSARWPASSAPIVP